MVGVGSEKSDYVWFIDFNNPLNNEFLVVNQYTVIENNQNKRPDILLFIKGIPLVLIELKNPADENATTRKAFDQIQTYKATIPGLFFTFNAFCVISDGHECKAGSTSADYSGAWHTQGSGKSLSMVFYAGKLIFFEESKTKESILIADPIAYYGNYPGTGFNYKRFFSVTSKEKLSML